MDCTILNYFVSIFLYFLLILCCLFGFFFWTWVLLAWGYLQRQHTWIGIQKARSELVQTSTYRSPDFRSEVQC